MEAKLIEQIPGMIEFDLDVYADDRGYFKENFQKAKLVELGLPADFEPIQNNISYNRDAGVTRGLHAEPWDKYIALGGKGKAFGAWVDLRAGETFGNTYYTELDESKAIYVPRGVANSYQTLTEDVVYTYLVNEHWRADAKYAAINLDSPEVAIPWPIELSKAIISEKDLNNPQIGEIEKMEV
jgi:dTDP-4-dehydrorhamnose 3,5-epimerase and related enzymes